MFGHISHVCFCLSLSVFLSEGARRVDLNHPRVKRSLHIREQTPEQVLGLHNGEHLVPGNKFRTAAGTTKVKMEETYLGLPVIGEAVVMEVNNEGQYTGEIDGQLMEGIQEDVPSIDPELSKTYALHIALQKTGHNVDDIKFNPDNDAVLKIYVKGVEDVHACLVYSLNYRIESRRLMTRPTFIINANTGKIIKEWDAMSMSAWKNRQKGRVEGIRKYSLVEGEGGNKKIGKYIFGLDYPELRVTSLGNGTCVLENEYGVIYDCNHSYDCDDVKPYQFDCEKGVDDIVNGAYSPMSDALFYVGITYEMYADWYEISEPIKPTNLNGGRCTTFVHYGDTGQDINWDGGIVHLSDGDDQMYPATSINVVAHEVSHGFTEANSGLIYIAESGGMNEAFSDMAGEAAEDFLKHNVDWTVGYPVMKAENKSLRYFDDPTKDGISLKHVDDMCFKTEVHQSSGIYNKVFYLLSNSPGWCVRKAFHIFVIANDIYWRPDSSFVDGACDVLKATRDLGYSQEDVKAAFRAVGIEPCVPNHTMGNMVRMKKDSHLEFILSNRYDEDIDYTYLLLAIIIDEEMIYSIRTSYMEYQIKYVEGDQIPSINLGRQCFKGNCSISIYAPMEGTSIIMPMAVFDTVVTGVDLHENRTITVDGTHPNNSTEEWKTFSTDFEVPNYIVDNKIRVFVIGTAAKGRGSFYIRKDEPPPADSPELSHFTGSLTKRGSGEEPTWLCYPKRGTYYIMVVLESEFLTDVRLELAAMIPNE